jgi:hypothetical protein
MDERENQESPLAIILIATFFILVGAWFFAQISFSKTSITFFSILLSLIGTLFIVVGWSILDLKPWGYYLGTAISGCSLFFGLMFGVLILMIAPLYVLILLLFIPVFLLLLRYKYLYIETPQIIGQNQIDNRGRICPKCGKSIPFDANICPYCTNKFKNYL